MVPSDSREALEQRTGEVAEPPHLMVFKALLDKALLDKTCLL